MVLLSEMAWSLFSLAFCLISEDSSVESIYSPFFTFLCRGLSTIATLLAFHLLICSLILKLVQQLTCWGQWDNYWSWLAWHTLSSSSVFSPAIKGVAAACVCVCVCVCVCGLMVSNCASNSFSSGVEFRGQRLQHYLYKTYRIQRVLWKKLTLKCSSVCQFLSLF